MGKAGILQSMWLQRVRHDLADNKAIDQEAKKKEEEAKLKGSRVLVLFRKQQKYYFTLDFNKTRMLSAPKNSEKL